jgi:uncharacterized membrane protein
MARPNLRHHHNVLLLCILALFVLLGILGVKYLWVKQEWRGNAVALQEGIRKFQNAGAVEDAQILTTTIVSVPAGFTPLIKMPAALQKYVSLLSSQTGRDIVVMDKNNKIIADTVAANIGTTYTVDNGLIAKTLFDGSPRLFIEKSTDYPDGITETAVQIKDANGTIIGTLLISLSNIFK